MEDYIITELDELLSHSASDVEAELGEVFYAIKDDEESEIV